MVRLRLYSAGEDVADFSSSHEGNLQLDVPGKHKNHGRSLSSSTSAHDLKRLDVEKERKNDASPRGVLEVYINGSESESSSPLKGNAESEHPNTKSRAHSNWTRFFKLWKIKSPVRLSSLAPLPVPKILSGKSRSSRENPALRDIYNYKSSLRDFTLADLKTATNNFNQENMIGRGGFSEVYKGRLPDGKLVAIKKLTRGNADEKTASFLSEIGIMAHVDHPNNAKLLGCGIEGGMHLIFELSPLGSLHFVLHESNIEVDWSKRYKIALGTADGLMYLHETCPRRIIHRDIKVDNILLTEDFEPQICDFGIAKWLPREWTHRNVSKFEGTFGYFAPEYFMHGIVDEKTDIFAFGVLLLELITGRRALDESQQSLVLWAKPLLYNNDLNGLVDPAVGDNYDKEEVDRVALTASLCIEQSPILRPRMHEVVILLRGGKFAAEIAERDCQKRKMQRTYSEELLHTQEYNSTKYLNDIKRHREVALSSGNNKE